MLVESAAGQGTTHADTVHQIKVLEKIVVADVAFLLILATDALGDLGLERPVSQAPVLRMYLEYI
jgi:hypothetical protein